MVFTWLDNPGKTTRLHCGVFMEARTKWRSRFHFLISPQHLWRISFQHLSLKAVTGLSVSDQSLNTPPGVSLPKSSACFGSPGDEGSRHPLKKALDDHLQALGCSAGALGFRWASLPLADCTSSLEQIRRAGGCTFLSLPPPLTPSPSPDRLVSRRRAK